MPGDKSDNRRIFRISCIFPDFVRVFRIFDFPELPEVKNRGNRENYAKIGRYLDSFYRKQNEKIPKRTYFKNVRTQVFFIENH